MRVVVAIAERGSLTAAAHQLDISLPSVVRVLADAERRLAVRLFDRTTRRLNITEEGAIYVETCRRVLNEIADVEEALGDRRVEAQGTLAITAPVLFGRMHVVPLLNDFLHTHPRISARVVLLDRVVDLIEEGIDVAVRIGEVSEPGVIAIPVGQVRRCLCAAPALIKRFPAIDTAEALCDVPFIQHSGLMQSHELKLPSKAHKRPIALKNIRITTNQGDAAIAACRAALGVGLFLSYQVADLLKEGELVKVLPAIEFDSVPVSLIYLPTRRLSARTRVFLAWAKEALTLRLAAL